MKQMLLIAIGLLLVGSVAFAAEFTTSGNTGVFTHDENIREECDWISQNFDPWAVEVGSQVACANQADGYTTENWWARQYFLLEDHWIEGDIGVCQIAFGVESLTGDMDIDLVLYTISNTHGVAFGWGDITEVARQSVSITPADELSILEVELLDPPMANADTHNFVVAIDAPHGEGYGPGGANVMFWSGANPYGALMDSYLASESCGLPDPTPVSAIGFPDAQTVLNLCVGEDCGEPTPVEDTSWGAVKSLYR